MNELQTAKIKEHLEKAKILESRIFTLNNMISLMDEKINYLKSEKYVPEPRHHRNNFNWISPFMIILLIAFVALTAMTASSTFDFIGIILCVLSVILIFFSAETMGIVFGSIGIAIVGTFILYLISAAITAAKNGKIDKEHGIVLNQAGQEHQKELAKAKIITNQKMQLIQKRRSAEAMLENIYRENIIYPKYRNMVAVLSMYEYFTSGRCTELTGHEGAYNIYENELRLNIIISSLDDILYRLDEIKQNQYVLYQELKSTQNMIDSLSGDLNYMMSSVNAVERNSSIAAYNSKMAAEDTRLLTYINMINQ